MQFLALISILFLVGCASQPHSQRVYSSPFSQTSIGSATDRGIKPGEKEIAEVKASISARLKDPSSVIWGDVTVIPGSVYAKIQGKYTNVFGYNVVWHYNAKNSYGGFTGMAADFNYFYRITPASKMICRMNFEKIVSCS